MVVERVRRRLAGSVTARELARRLPGAVRRGLRRLAGEDPPPSPSPARATGGVRLILMYHRVASASSDPLELCVSPARFEEQLELLGSAGEILPLQELVRSRRPRRGLGVALTFDDGYADNALTAGPILASRAVPATVFVVSGAVGSCRAFWWDRLGATFLRDGGSLDDYWREWERLRVLPAAEIERELESLRPADDRVADPDTRPVSEAELRALAAGPVEIGAHTVSHPSLTALPADEQEREIARSRDRLQQLLGIPVEAFAYPYGDYDSTTVRLAKRAGFAVACTIHEGPLSRLSSPFRLPRYAARNWTADELERRLAAWTGGRSLTG